MNQDTLPRGDLQAQGAGLCDVQQDCRQGLCTGQQDLDGLRHGIVQVMVWHSMAGLRQGCGNGAGGTFCTGTATGIGTGGGTITGS
ncbi:MAG: hypothetical protein FWC27_08380 [Firmicutes bacterium]|nr:hypothetical protein [Bacillota bacterium]